MRERLSSPNLPDVVLEKAHPERRIGDFRIKKIKKTGSTLHLLERGQNERIVRNGEIPLDSMAAWELLQDHAAPIIKEDVRKRLYGPWSSPQVVPILTKDGKNRVRYSKQTASAYSEMAGVDTYELVRLAGLEEVFRIYSQFPVRKPRSSEAVAYHLTRDAVTDGALGEKGRALLDLMDIYWNEFERLNASKIPQDVFRKREIEVEDIEWGIHHSSLALVESGHAIIQCLTDMYRACEKSEESLTWKERPLKDVLLLLIHLYQTAVQQKIFWWLGVSHGHAHLGNTVSRASTPGSMEAQISPLVTSIIDLDRAKVAPGEIIWNTELLASIDSRAVKERLVDPKLHLHLRQQLLFYLPVEEWDEETRLVVEQCDMATKRKIAWFIAHALQKEPRETERYNWFFEIVRGLEQQDAEGDDEKTSFPFSQVAFMARDPEAPRSSSSILRLLARYAEEGLLPDIHNLSESGRCALLGSIYYRYRARFEYADLNISSAELNFIVTQLHTDGVSGDISRVFLAELFGDQSKVLAQLFENAKAHNPSSHIADEITHFIFSSLEDGERLSKWSFLLYPYNEPENPLRWAVFTGNGAEVLERLDLKRLPKETAKAMYHRIRKWLQTDGVLEKKEEEREGLIRGLDLRAKEAFGGWFLWVERVKTMLAPKSSLIK